MIRTEEQKREYARKYYQEHKKKALASNRKWQKEHPERVCELSKRTYYKHREKRLKRGRERKREIKLEVLSHYSKGKIECAHCGEKEFKFLSIDHIHGGGAEHRKKLGIGAGTDFYYWLIRNNYPSGYRVLCLSCNWIFSFRERKRKIDARVHFPQCQCEGCDESRIAALTFSNKFNKVLCRNCWHALTFYKACPHQNKKKEVKHGRD